MPKRQNTYRVNSEKIQGAGSWVELSYITYGEFQAILTDEIKPSELLEEHVIDWNWIDKQGESFGKPVDCTDSLYAHERTFLLDCLYNPEENAIKN